SQHGDWFGACLQVRLERRPSDQRRDAHYVERIAGAVIATQPLGVAFADPFRNPCYVADGRCDDAFEDSVARADLQQLIHAVVSASKTFTWLNEVDAYQSIDILVGEGIDDH